MIGHELIIGYYLKIIEIIYNHTDVCLFVASVVYRTTHVIVLILRGLTDLMPHASRGRKEVGIYSLF